MSAPQKSICIVTEWYPPEHAPFGRMMQELAHGLVARGWAVTVITGFPNHPRGVVFEGYTKRWLSTEMDGNVRVLRVWLATSARRSLARRLATFVTFTVTSAWRLLRNRRSDVIFAVLQPLSVGITLPLLARVKRSTLVLNLQDLHPDAQIRLGMIRNRPLIAVLRWIERYAYRHCDALSVICDAFARHAIARGADAQRVAVVPNWIDTERLRPDPQGARSFRAELELREEHFVALWAGTLGHVSGAGIVVDAAQRLREHAAIRFVIIGEGPLLPALKKQVASLGLDNVVFRDFQPEGKLSGVQSAADVSLVTLQPSLADVSVPSKVLAYFASGRPVIAAVPEASETAQLLRRSRAGIIVQPGDAAALAEAIRSAAMHRDELAEMGRAARQHAEENLSRAAAVARYESLFAALRSRA